MTGRQSGWRYAARSIAFGGVSRVGPIHGKGRRARPSQRAGGPQAGRPGNGHSDEITLEKAFAQSSNVAAVRLFREVGDSAVIRMARDLGVKSPLARKDPSLALGTSSMTLLELTAAYAGVAANAFAVEPRAFAAEEPGFFERLTSSKRSLSGLNTRQSSGCCALRSIVGRGGRRCCALPTLANRDQPGQSRCAVRGLFWRLCGWSVGRQ